MFGTIRKHQKWLWFVIVGVVIFGMVTWTNQLNKSGNQQRQGGGDFGSIGGQPITEAEYRNAQAEVAFLYFLNTGEWPDTGPVRPGFDLQQQTLFRVMLIRKLEEYNIRADSDSAAAAANNILRSFGRGEPFSTFLQQRLIPHNITAEDFQRFIEHDIAKEQLMSVVGLSGQLVAPAEIESLFVREHQELVAQAVFFSASNYIARVGEPSPDVLGQFYTNRQADYREPDKLQLSYVFYNVTNFMPEAQQKLGTNLATYVQEDYRKLGTNALSLGKTEAEAKAKIREILIQQVAISNANSQAITFHNELMAKEPPQAGNLATLAKEKGLEVKVTKPFDKQYRADELNLGQNFPTAALFNLTAEEPFAERPIRGMDGVYVLAFNKLIPSRIPPLEEIHNRVLADYKNYRATRSAQESGRAFAQILTNALAQGRTFAAISTEAKVNPISLPPFSYSTETLPEIEEQMTPDAFKRIAFNTPVGKASDFNPTPEGGVVVYVRERLPIDPVKMKAQLPEFSKLVRQGREKEAFDFWFSAQANAVLHENPRYQTRQQGRS